MNIDNTVINLPDSAVLSISILRMLGVAHYAGMMQVISRRKPEPVAGNTGTIAV